MGRLRQSNSSHATQTPVHAFATPSNVIPMHRVAGNYEIRGRYSASVIHRYWKEDTGFQYKCHGCRLACGECDHSISRFEIDWSLWCTSIRIWDMDYHYTTTMKIQTFVNSWIRRIVGVWWHEIISNEQLSQRTCQMPVEQEILQRRWRWIGQIPRKSVESKP